MTLSQTEYEEIMKDEGKVIEGNIAWTPSNNPEAQTFRIDIESGSPLFVQGWYNPFAEKLSYTIIHRGVGRIYGLDLGVNHRNPDGQLVGEKHKNYWAGCKERDKWAYVPEDITEPWNRPQAVWAQFCAEANLRHLGAMRAPKVQMESAL